jgi:acetyl esterase
MSVLPELEPLLARIRAAGPPDHSLPVSERRAQVHAGIDAQQAHMVEPVPSVPFADHRVAAADGEITVRVYSADAEEQIGCHLFIHGGGWWMARSIRATSPAAGSSER